MSNNTYSIPLSIVVPTFRRNEQLLECILSIIRQKYLPKEIIIIDTCPKNTAQHISQRSNISPSAIRYISVPTKNVSEARNRGIYAANYNHIIFIDDDCIAGKEWLKSLYKSLYRFNSCVGRGIEHITPTVGFLVKVESYLTFSSYHSISDQISKRSHIQYIDSKCFLVNKHVLIQHNILFDTQFNATFEDMDLSFQLIRAKVPIRNIYSMKIVHNPENTFFRLIRKQWNKGKDFVLFEKKWKSAILSKYQFEKLLQNSAIKETVRTLKYKNQIVSRNFLKKILKRKSKLYLISFHSLLFVAWMCRFAGRYYMKLKLALL